MSMVTSSSWTSWALLATSNKVPSSCQGCCSSCLICRAGLSPPAFELNGARPTTQWKMGEKPRDEYPQEQRAEYLGMVSAIRSLQSRLTPFNQMAFHSMTVSHYSI
ncbi:hypothetical protein BDQ94DRAFT_144984 [Aspergillus welwitschiae]|uniref:Uncharacterized protein n=1 Tax=Aspergillus welwitschiae TaxID=1341132 RepID=A0A3F3Q260_9EURO|nr:hypothetical protein BDQ94DRAFT_144984 [Aspergillus welwitschiae]RDH32766.1 hypothetical protein BDQ94DRAFT_144984 [Aspergillus welwitschiae]